MQFSCRLLLGVVATVIWICSGAQCNAQAKPTATRPLSLWMGGEYSNFKPDYGTDRLSGIAVFADLDTLHYWGIEAEARWSGMGNPNDQALSNYLAGGRARYALHHGEFQPYAKLLVGAGNMRFPNGGGHGSYFAIVPGIGADVRVASRLRVRLEYEFQLWPSAPGLPTSSTHGLTPSGFNTGLSWRLP